MRSGRGGAGLMASPQARGSRPQHTAKNRTAKNAGTIAAVVDSGDSGAAPANAANGSAPFAARLGSQDAGSPVQALGGCHV